MTNTIGLALRAVEAHLEKASPSEIAFGGVCHFDSEFFKLVGEARDGSSIRMEQLGVAARHALAMIAAFQSSVGSSRYGVVLEEFITSRAALFAEIVQLSSNLIKESGHS